MSIFLTFDIVRPDTVSGKFIAGKASVRTSKKGWAYMKRSDFEKIARQIFRQQTPKEWRLDGAFKVTIMCFFALEKSNSKKLNERLAGWYYTKKPDDDNITKGIQDGMSGVLFNDDAQVALLEVGKFYQCTKGEPPLAVVTVERLGDEIPEIIEPEKLDIDTNGEMC